MGTHSSQGDGAVMGWSCALQLDQARRAMAGGTDQLAAAIRGGADLRIGTEFVHNQHIDVTSGNAEPIREVAEFAVTYLIDGAWTAGIMSLRQPVELPVGFGERPSMSFFLYNQDGSQAIARPYLDGREPGGEPGRSPDEAPPDMPLYHVEDSWDAGTNAPSQNFVYDFGFYRYFVSECWDEVLAHDADGRVLSGDVAALAEAFSGGCEVKVAVEGLCADLCAEGGVPPTHEVFIQAGSAYYYTQQRLFMVGTHPLVRVRPATPLRYSTGAWDFGWLMLRSDGHAVYRRCDPYTLRFEDRVCRHGIWWFVR